MGVKGARKVCLKRTAIGMELKRCRVAHMQGDKVIAKGP